MVSIESIGEQFAEMGIEPEPAIIGRCKCVNFAFAPAAFSFDFHHSFEVMCI